MRTEEAAFRAPHFARSAVDGGVDASCPHSGQVVAPDSRSVVAPQRGHVTGWGLGAPRAGSFRSGARQNSQAAEAGAFGQPQLPHGRAAGAAPATAGSGAGGGPGTGIGDLRALSGTAEL
jgi:hypothetical protein